MSEAPASEAPASEATGGEAPASTASTAGQSRRWRLPQLGLAARLYIAIGGAVAFTLTASVVAWYSFIELGERQHSVASRHLPAITLSLRLARQSALIAATAPKLLTVDNERERLQTIRDIDALESALQQLINALDGTIDAMADEAGSSGDALDEVRAETQEFSNSLLALGQSVGLEIALESQLADRVEDAVDVHRRLVELIAPLMDDTTFYLVTGYRSLDDTAPVPMEERIDEASLLHFAALADLTAEVNEMVGLLTEAAAISDAAQLRPLRERFDAASDGFHAALSNLAPGQQRMEIGALHHRLVALGRSGQGIIDLRRQILEHQIASRELVDRNRMLAANLTQDVEAIVEAAQAATRASVAATNETIEFGRELLLFLNGFAILGSIALGWFYVKRAFTTPVLQLTAAAEHFERHRFEPEMLAKTARRSDELGHLAQTFTRMAAEVQARQDTLDRLVAERTQQLAEKNEALEQSLKQIADELAMAQRMQLSILPRRVPELDSLALFARMQAARSVGGDFYDIIELDGDRVGIVIADVSDKGVPAALLMAVCCTRIKSIAMRGVEPGKVMEELNRTLSDENETAMFVTAFYGVVDLANGHLSYANAGHDAPFLLRGQAPAQALPRTGGIALGLVPDATYEEHSVELQPGDTVFFYTDGITEAFDRSGKAFSALRLKEVLFRARTLSVESLCRTVIEDIETYTKGCPQSDDITCVAIRYRPASTEGAGEETSGTMAGRASVEMVFEMPAELEELSKLAEAVEGFVEENGLPAKLGFQLNLVLDELLTNTISYGCADGAQCRLEVRLRLRGDKKKGEVVLVIEDDAAPFNPLDVPPPDLDKPLEEREVGGLGVHLVRATMDTIDYERDGGLNRLTLRKKLES